MQIVRGFLRRIRDGIGSIPLKSYVIFLLEGIGIIANLIAIVSYFGASNTSDTSPNFYINNQEFFAWSTVAVIYTLGLILARMKRRWRRLYGHRNENGNIVYQFFTRARVENADWLMYKRNFSFTLLIGFPLVFLYVRAIQTSINAGNVSPWNSLLITVLICVPVTLGGMVIASIFDNALSLYEGD